MAASHRSAKEAHKWTPAETRRLIRYRSDNEKRFMQSKMGAKQQWEKFVKEAGLEGKVTGQQASKKWENLKQKYKELRTPKTGSGTDLGEVTVATWQYYADMHEVLGARPAMDPPVVVASYEPGAEETVSLLLDILEPSTSDSFLFDTAASTSEILCIDTLLGEFYLYVAPEVFLGAPYNEGIDMWSVGCIIMELFIGRLLFRGDDTYETFSNIINTLGVPTLKLLKRSKYTDKYLIYKDRHWLFRKSGKIAPIISSLAKVYSYMPKNEADQRDFEFLRDLVKLMLKLDPAERVTPDELLKHSFVTMDHLRKFRDLHPDFVSECVKLSCAALDDEVTSYSHLDDDEWDSTSSEELRGPKMSSDRGKVELLPENADGRRNRTQ